MKNIQLPGSKSISNRVLLLAALSDAPVVLENLLDSDDTRYMRKALAQFGVKFEEVGGGVKVVGSERWGVGRDKGKTEKTNHYPLSTIHSSDGELYIGNAGTAARFLSCVSLLLGEGEEFTLTGNKYMEKRPQRDLFESLRSIGVGVECLKEDGFLPVRFLSRRPLRSTFSQGKNHLSILKISGKVSSQFLSGLLLVAPRMENGLTIEVIDDVPSWPYIEMTLEILKIWGVSVLVSEDHKKFVIKPGMKAPKKYIVPSDMSAASYPLAWSVLKKEKICITNFGSKTLQGDEGFLKIIEKVGATVRRQEEKCYIDPPDKILPIGDFNWEAMPDVSMTGMILAACADGESHFTGLESLRVKECDRIKAMAQLGKIGNGRLGVGSRKVDFQVEGDEVRIVGNSKLQIEVNSEQRIAISSYDDHRIAMCFGVFRSVLGFGVDYYNQSPIQIAESECVAKTWPDFWENLADWEGELRAVSGVIVKQVGSGKGRVSSIVQERKKQTIHYPLLTTHLSGTQEHYLIVKKPRKDHAWQFPQGGVDVGETDLNAAKRELMEECGANLLVKFKGERPVGEYKYFFPANFKRHDEDSVGAKVQFFEAAYLGGKVIVDNDEIIDYKWISGDEFGDYFEGRYLRVVQNFLIKP